MGRNSRSLAWVHVRRHNLEGDKRFEQLGGMGWLGSESSPVFSSWSLKNPKEPWRHITCILPDMGEQLVKHLWYTYIYIYGHIWSYICLSMICSEVPIISDELLHLNRGIWSFNDPRGPIDPRLANASEVFETATDEWLPSQQWRPGWIAWRPFPKSRKTENRGW